VVPSLRFPHQNPACTYPLPHSLYKYFLGLYQAETEILN
jgi:hypothetical protein